MSTTATHHAPCGLCDHDIPEGESITLWNGKSYCAECLKKYSPTLFEYAASHETLIEIFPTTAPKDKLSWWKILEWTAYIYCFTTGSLFAWQDSLRGGMWILHGVFWLFFILMIAASVVMGYQIRKYIRNLASIDCTHGEIHIHDRAGQLIQTVPLTNLKCIHADNEPMSVDYCLALHIKQQKSWKPNWILAFCGHTPEMKKVWKDFFKLSGVPVEY